MKLFSKSSVLMENYVAKKIQLLYVCIDEFKTVALAEF